MSVAEFRWLCKTIIPLTNTKPKKQKIIKDTSVAMIDYLSKNKELQEAKDKSDKSDEYEMRRQGYLFYSYDAKLLSIHKYSEIDDKIHKYYLSLKDTRERKNINWLI